MTLVADDPTSNNNYNNDNSANAPNDNNHAATATTKDEEEATSTMTEDVENNNNKSASLLEEAAQPVPTNEGDANNTNSDEQPTTTTNDRWWRFGGVPQAQGLCALGAGRGALIMSNIFLASSLIYLASKEADCLDPDDSGEILDSCDQKVYGFSPASLVPNMAVISGILSAFFMPIFGAMLDYTKYRKLVGVATAIFILLIQAVQIYTVSDTWFAMAILQAIGGFIFQIQVLATYSYFPETSRRVGEATMTSYSSIFTSVQFFNQALFLLVIIVGTMLLGVADDSVVTAQISQGINVLWTALFFLIGWRALPSAPASRPKPADKNLIVLGFSQMMRTARTVNKYYKVGLRWYLLGLVFAEAGVNAFTTVSVVYMSDHLKLSGTEIGIVFLLTLLFTLPGTLIGATVTRRTDPKRSWIYSLVGLIIVTAGGAFLVDVLPVYSVYGWGVFIGLLFGWFYPTENFFFSMIVPHGQEAELSGFFVYCTQILVWLPPLFFTALVEFDVSQTYGVMTLAIFFLIAILILTRAGKWEEIVAESKVVHDIEL